MNVSTYVTTKISSESDASFLEEYHITPGDEILKINGHKVYNEYDVSRIITSSENDNMEFLIKGVNGNQYTRTITIEKKTIGSIGTYFENETVYDVLKDSPSEKAGLKKGDVLIAVNGNSGDIVSFINELRENPNVECTVTINRDDEVLDLIVVPNEVTKRTMPFSFVVLRDLDFWHNLYYSWRETKSYLIATIVGIGELIGGNAENVEVQGIVGVSSQISKTESLIEFFYFMSAISLSLGIMNILPIPGLDGGKILITLIELVRGKPLKKEIEGMITMIGFSILLFLIIAITLNDISNL
jgi:regulator of sigma E protease